MRKATKAGIKQTDEVKDSEGDYQLQLWLLLFFGYKDKWLFLHLLNNKLKALLV